MSEKGMWTAEAWITPELHVVVNTGKEEKVEHINRASLNDATVVDIVKTRLGLVKDAKTVVVEVDGKIVKPSEAQKIAAVSVMEIYIYPSGMKREVVAPAKKVKQLVDDRKYHQHRGITSSHKVADNHKDPATQRYHDNEIKIHKEA